MSKRKLLTPEGFIERMNEAGWSVQGNGRVLCPRWGAELSLSADRTRGYLHLKTGIRTLVDTHISNHVMSPPEIMVDGIRIVSFEQADLRDADVLAEAAAMISELGETEGVLTRQGGYRKSVEVRTGGVSVVREQARPNGERETSFPGDPRPARPTPGMLSALLMMCAPALG